MSSVKKISLAVALGLATISAPAQAAGVQIGQLSCIVDGGIGFIFGSSKQLNCTFTPADAASSQETYTGSVDKMLHLLKKPIQVQLTSMVLILVSHAKAQFFGLWLRLKIIKAKPGN